ncbi:non-hydrolyzing UDP-N-acetylglucosamine 2-epimerase [Candidatus Harpocratesius sp.]
MKILSVVATRPNFIKEFAIQHALEKNSHHNEIEWRILHTGQHYDYQMSKIFLEELNIPEPYYYLNVGSGSLGYQRGKTIIEIEKTLIDYNPDLVIIYGDVNATMSAAIACNGLNIPFYHLEAGVRGNNPKNPEETNRIIADCLSNLNICFTKEHVQNLKKEGYPNDKIFLSGDLHYDVFLHIKKKFNLVAKNEDYILVTIHRQENRRNIQNLKNIIGALVDIDENIKWPVHPGTKKDLQAFGLWNELIKNKKIELLPPLGYLEFTKLLKNCKFVFTDSGGVRREAYFWKKPTLILININWFNEIEKYGWKKTVGSNRKEIVKNFRNFKIPNEHPKIFGNGDAAEKIINYILEKSHEVSHKSL